jgi:hypothetical protein
MVIGEADAEKFVRELRRIEIGAKWPSAIAIPAAR